MIRSTQLCTEKFKFIDSIQHLPSSLETLTEDLVEDGYHNFKPLRDYVRTNWNDDEDKFKLLTRKGVYPYSFMSEQSRLEYNHLPPKESFYNDLKEEECSDKDYEHVKRMWEKFEMKTLGDLTRIYCISDVLLLTSIFNKYREQSLRDFSLEPLCYYTAPGEFSKSSIFVK